MAEPASAILTTASTRRSIWLLSAALCLAAGCGSVLAAEDHGEPARKVGAAESVKLAKPLPKSAPKGSEVEQYCANIGDAAADARFAWQAQTLADLSKELDGKIAALEAKRAEYEAWLTRREDFLAKVEKGVVDIYSKMRPEAAATQLASMKDEAAAALLAKLSTRVASAILNEMDPARGARLTNTISGMTAAEDEDQDS